MTTPSCPPLEIDAELLQMIEEYRAAKRAAASATVQGSRVERAGHYDKDTPLQTRTAQEGEATVDERTAATHLADKLLAWVDRHR